MSTPNHNFSDDIIASSSNPFNGSDNRTTRWIKIIGWSALTLFCLVLFTFLKLPDDRLKNLINGNIAAILADRGITFTPGESDISLLLGVSYKMKNISLGFQPPTPPAHIDKIVLSPSILAALMGKKSGTLEIKNGDGQMNISFAVKNTDGSFSFKFKKIDIGKLALLPLLASVQGTAVLDGNGNISGDMAVPNTLEGNTNLNFSKFMMDAQNISGFNVPKINISEGIADIALNKGKATLKNVRLGKSGNKTEDIQGTVTGDINLGKNWDSSTLNVKVRFTLSDSILKSFALLDAILGAGKQSDGSYAFSLTGPISNITPTPLGGSGT